MNSNQSLEEFVALVRPDYAFYKHNKVIIQNLQRVTDGQLKRLIILMPPRYGATELISRLFPAYFLSRHPSSNTVLSTYSADLARANAAAALQYHKVAGCECDSSAFFGPLRPLGVGGATTGVGFDLGIIDSPLRSPGATTPKILEHIEEWYNQAFATHMKIHGAIVLVMWHAFDQDLVGHLLSREEEYGVEDGQGWHILNLTAIKDPSELVPSFPPSCSVEEDWRKVGESLCPERFPIEALQEMQASIGERLWSGMYQQRPHKFEAHAELSVLALPNSTS